MIELTRINRVDRFWVNEDQIEYMEETPDTIITMVSGRKYAVAEKPEEIAGKIAQVKRAIFSRADFFNGDIGRPE